MSMWQESTPANATNHELPAQTLMFRCAEKNLQITTSVTDLISEFRMGLRRTHSHEKHNDARAFIDSKELTKCFPTE